MPANTGFIPDEDVVPSAPTATGPPPTVAGLDAVAAEPPSNPSAEGGVADAPFVDVRDRRFTLRSAIPGMLLMRLTDTQVKLQRAGNDQRRQLEALAMTGETIAKLVVEAERDDFIEYLETTEPPIETKEVSDLVRKMMEAVTGRPTQSASE